MKTVHKYTLAAADFQRIDLPVGAQPLCVREQGNNVCMWVLVDSDEDVYEVRHFRLAGTGHALHEQRGEEFKYVGTAHLQGGALVFHVFEILAV